MENIFTLQFPNSNLDAESVADALKNKTILTSDSWEVWPFLANINPIENEEEEGEGTVTSEDKLMLAFMRNELLREIGEKTKNGDYETLSEDVIKGLGYPVTKQTKAVVVKTLTAFRTIFSLCVAASYAKVFLPQNGGMEAFLETWKKEVTLACKMDSAYRKAYKTQGLICKNPRELMTLFTKVALAELLSTSAKPMEKNSVAQVAHKVSSGAITEDVLTRWEEILKGEMDPVLTFVGSFFSELSE